MGPGRCLDSSLDFLCDLSFAIYVLNPRRKVGTIRFLSGFILAFFKADYKQFSTRIFALSMNFYNVY